MPPHPTHPGTRLVPGLPRVPMALSGAVVCTQSAPGWESSGGPDDSTDLDAHCLLSPSPSCYLIRCPPGFLGLRHQLVTSVHFISGQAFAASVWQIARFIAPLSLELGFAHSLQRGKRGKNASVINCALACASSHCPKCYHSGHL